MSTCNTWHSRPMLRLGLSMAFGLVLLLGLLLAVGTARAPDVTRAQGPTVRYVDGATGTDLDNECRDARAPCATAQHAVDEADAGDEIRVATGIYTGVQGRPAPPGYPSPPDSGIVNQVVYISKTVTIRGGYTTANDFADPPNPETNPTTLDALEPGRVIFIAGAPAPGAGISPTVEGLRVTGGNAYWLGGGEEDNLYRGAGGGVYVINATATLSNCWLFGNAAFYGGGLYPRYGDATLSGITVTSNSAYDGGGLYLYDSDATLSGNTVTSNSAYNGGGLYLYDSTATLSSNTITSNTAYYSGGGLHLYGSTAMLSGNTVLSNTAGTGGGLHLYGSTAMLSGNTVLSNTASGDGGGLHLHDSAATLSSNTISSNTAGCDGGGLYLWDGAATLSSNTVSFNTADYSGGGLYLLYSDATLINNVVADNQANSAGSGLYISGSSPHLLHTTIARNGSASLTTGGGDGSGVYVVTGLWGGQSAVVLTNTILVSHTVGITVTAGNTVTLNGVLWYSNTINYGGEGTITVTNEYTGNPAFATDGYHLTSASAAIDKGVKAGVDDDIDGHARPQGGGYDLGADELPVVYLPLVVRNL